MATLKRLIFTIVLAGTMMAADSQDFNNIQFIENKGQWDSRVKFKGDIDAGAIFIRSSGFTIVKHNAAEYAAWKEKIHHHQKDAQENNKVIHSHAWDVDFENASPLMEVIPEKALPTYNNYFIGDDPSKWAGECRIFQAVTLKNVYPNVDVRYYTYKNTLKYDIIVKPGADISKIALRYKGVDKLKVKNKELAISTSIGEFRELYPYSYQSGLTEKREVNCKYVVKDNVVRFEVKQYDPSAILVIDPNPIFCSLSGSASDNWGFTATYGPDGSFFGGGIVFGGGFPVSSGAYQTTFATGKYDIGIIKLTPDGSNRVYATYIGGSGDDQPHSLIVNSAGELIVAGRTNSPLTGPGAYPLTGAVVGPGGSEDIVVTKLNAAGSALIGSRRIGGNGRDGVNIKTDRNGDQSLERNYGDDGRSEVIIDGAGNVYVASCSQSQHSGPVNGFPSAGAFQTAFGGGLQDGVLLKFNADLSVNLFASYLGGSGNDAAYVLSLGPSGDIYVAGGTEPGNSATDFPGNHAGTVGTASHGGIDGFVARISNDGSTIIRSAYIGTSGIDQVYGIQFDRNGFPYIMGQTTGNWPVINAAFSNPGGKQFIAKLQPDLSAYVYSTAFGSGASEPNISPIAFLVDRCENVYVSGWGGSVGPTGGPPYPTAGTAGLPVTADANIPPVLKSATDERDFYFFVLKRDAVSQLFGSFFGQNGGYGDHVDGGTSRFDANGVIYQAVCANCEGTVPFPTTQSAWAPTKPASAFCNLGMIKIAFNLAGVGADVQSAIGGVPNDTAGCLPLDVTFTDVVRNATEYIWNFGDGPDVGPLPATAGYTQTHTYNAVGTYQVMLVAINPSSCNIRDTAYIHIRVGDLKANLDASPEKLPPCDGFNYRFHNLSNTDPSRPFTDTSFSWDFGDGSPQVVAGMNTVTHTYPGPGTYTAWLILHDTNYCNNPDSLEIRVSVAANVAAKFETSPTGCAPYTAEFNNISEAGMTFEWNFGDPDSGPDNTSTLFSPTHVYTKPGTYTITLVANDPNTCNKTDTTSFPIIVYDKPTASFSYTPVTPEINTPNIFTNLSSTNATRFTWRFGDGDTLSTTSRADVVHQYTSTGTFQACLVAYNEVGCSDDTCIAVETLIDPVVDVPNAFTPNSGNINSVVKVRGFGIVKMQFTIWNRWGQKVFESNSLNQGWDGKVKGVVQPMDVYAYALDVEFFDGAKVRKTGDITLIR